MANYYCDGSETLEIPENKWDRVMGILVKEQEQIEESDDGCCQVDIDLNEEHHHIWFHTGCQDYLNMDHVERIVKRILEEAEIDDPFFMEAAFTCSKERSDGFGGCGFRAQRGRDTLWINTNDIHTKEEENK
jgi:hypothetical protein